MVNTEATSDDRQSKKEILKLISKLLKVICSSLKPLIHQCLLGTGISVQFPPRGRSQFSVNLVCVNLGIQIPTARRTLISH